MPVFTNEDIYLDNFHCHLAHLCLQTFTPCGGRRFTLYNMIVRGIGHVAQPILLPLARGASWWSGGLVLLNAGLEFLWKSTLL